MLQQNLQELRLRGRTRTFLQDRRSLTEPGHRLAAETSHRREYQREKKLLKMTKINKSKKSTAHSTRVRLGTGSSWSSRIKNSHSRFSSSWSNLAPYSSGNSSCRRSGETIDRDRRKARGEPGALTLKKSSRSAASVSSVRTSEWKLSTVL